jgi:hypothetical protein
MVRTQIQFTRAQHAWLKRWARRLGISLSEAVRRCVEEKLAGEVGAGGRAERVRAALAVVGKHHDPAGRARVARDHDLHFAKADVVGGGEHAARGRRVSYA